MITAAFVLTLLAMVCHGLGNIAYISGDKDAHVCCRLLVSGLLFAEMVAIIVYWCVT